MDRIIAWRGRASTLRVDDGPEYISGELIGAEKRGLTLQHGQPQQNASIEHYTRTETEIAA